MKASIPYSDFLALDRLFDNADRLQWTHEGFVGIADLSLEGIHAAQQAVMAAVERHLAVEAWDTEKRAAIANCVDAGGRPALEAFLEQLGVAVESKPMQGGA